MFLSSARNSLIRSRLLTRARTLFLSNPSTKPSKFPHHAKTLTTTTTTTTDTASPSPFPSQSQSQSRDDSPPPVLLPSKEFFKTIHPNKFIAKNRLDIEFAEHNACGENLNIVFYYIAFWSEACKRMNPFIEELIKKYSNVAFVIIDVGKPNLESELVGWMDFSVPAFRFIVDGKTKRKDTDPGDNITLLKQIMEELYEEHGSDCWTGNFIMANVLLEQGRHSDSDVDEEEDSSDEDDDSSDEDDTDTDGGDDNDGGDDKDANDGVDKDDDAAADGDSDSDSDDGGGGGGGNHSLKHEEIEKGGGVRGEGGWRKPKTRMSLLLQ